MRIEPLVLVCFAAFASVQGQSLLPDSLRRPFDTLTFPKLSKLDSATRNINERIDSVQLRINRALNPDLNQLSERISFKRKPSLDSLGAARKLDSIRGSIRNKIDSLASLNLPTDRYTRKLDSLNQIGPAKYVQMAESKADDLKARINKPVDKVESKINETLGRINSEAGGTNLPGSVNLPGAELNTDLGIEGKFDLPKTDLDISNPLGKIDNPLKDQAGEMGGLKEKIGDVKSMPQEQIGKLKSIEEVNGAQETLGKANELTDKAQAYQEDVKAVAQGNLGEVKQLPEAIENKARNLEEVRELEKHTGEVNQYKDMIDKGNNPAFTEVSAGRPEALKEMARDQAISYAKDHFAGQQAVLQTAMEKMSKLKSKYSHVTSLLDLPKRPPNPMKGKPLIERLVPGVTLQILKTHNVMIDLNPVVVWRFTGRLSTGGGWNERVSFSEWNKTVTEDRIYGPRLFVSFSMRSGFSFKAEGERMNVLIPPFTLTPDAGHRVWVWSTFVGMKKDYRFIRKTKGNVQLLYNIYDDRDQSPYLDRLNVRMGFEFPMKKKARPRSSGV